MAPKCVHQGCGKEIKDPEEACHYHPGPPIFHEGQKGWKCCKPRVLTFDEFLEIEPCTTGKHSTTDLPPQIEKKEAPSDPALLKEVSATAGTTPGPALPRGPVNVATPSATPPPPPPESDDDDPSLEIPDGRQCRRRACGASYKKGTERSETETCVHHPGVPIFHEGSKGYSCCKRRVLEFDEFMKIEGCQTKNRHLYVGSGKKDKAKAAGAEELLETVRLPCDRGEQYLGTFMLAMEGCWSATEPRQITSTPLTADLWLHCHVPHAKPFRSFQPDKALLLQVQVEVKTKPLTILNSTDFYQTPSSVIASFFLKKIDKDAAKVAFTASTVKLDLPTGDSPPKRYRAEVPLFGAIDPDKTTFKILGTKLEVTLAKAEVSSWPVLRADDRPTGEILQVGRAGKVQ